MQNDSLADSPLYDPNVQVRKFRFEKDYANIRLNLLGTGKLYTDPKFWFYLEDRPDKRPKEWKRPREICSHPFFIDGIPDRFDALQGFLSNCWLISAMEALTFNEKLIKHVIPPDQGFDKNYIGAFHFRIWQLGFWYDVVVDDRLPVFKDEQELCYARSMRGDVFWAALLEKAYAKLCSTKTASYGSLEAPDYITTGLQDLSGGIAEKFPLNKLPRDTTVQWFVKETFSKKALMTLSTNKADMGLRKAHAYTITKVFKCADDDPDYHGLFLVRLMNPWGLEEWEGTWSDGDFDMWKQIDRNLRRKLGFVQREDGEFWMDDTDIAKYFDMMSVCYLGPGQYLISHKEPEHESWGTEILLGEWVKGISAGGSSLSNRHKNPQYIIQLGWPENDTNVNGMCTVIIELVSRSKQGREIRPKIGFYVYYLSAPIQQIPLDEKFFKEHQTRFDDSPKFEERSFLVSTELEIGKHCIVPCTEKENEESNFLLRVFTESDVQLREHDTRISKSLTMKEETFRQYDKGLKNMFDNIAQGEEEIDWIGLRQLLDSAMKPKSSFFRIVLSFCKTIGTVFKTFLSLGSDDYDNSDVEFSKDECRSMIAMLDDNNSGKLSFSGFSQLWDKICFWKIIYGANKDEAEGYISVTQLRDALSSVGYDINKRTVHSLSYVYANDQGNISLIDFILCGVALETVLTLGEKNHVNNKSKITFSLKEWVKNTLIV